MESCWWIAGRRCMSAIDSAGWDGVTRNAFLGMDIYSTARQCQQWRQWICPSLLQVTLGQAVTLADSEPKIVSSGGRAEATIAGLERTTVLDSVSQPGGGGSQAAPL
jgi:hypothetical protein